MFATDKRFSSPPTYDLLSVDPALGVFTRALCFSCTSFRTGIANKSCRTSKHPHLYGRRIKGVETTFETPGVSNGDSSSRLGKSEKLLRGQACS
jgi:hypothetical protein